MNTFAIVMQQGAMSSAQQWVVIGLSLAVLASVWAVSGAQQMSRRAVNLTVGLVVALAVAALATTASAAIYIPCTDPAGVQWWWWAIWGC